MYVGVSACMCVLVCICVIVCICVRFCVYHVLVCLYLYKFVC